MSPQPGEVWLADLGLAAKTRPVIIVSRHDPDPPRALVLYVPLTTQNRMSQYEFAPAVRVWDSFNSMSPTGA
ncbi:MAG: type II toxin-antitoxin system PemK/MazF family toxin [Candidatus Solibacter usitatus]|nr:type II toxin-antitoxin system PemK/MazF family toxin [Candidatus Solibacter usitatus]